MYNTCKDVWKYCVLNIMLEVLTLPGTAAGDSGPVRDGVTLAGEPTGDGEGPRMPGRWGGV